MVVLALQIVPTLLSQAFKNLVDRFLLEQNFRKIIENTNEFKNLSSIIMVSKTRIYEMKISDSVAFSFSFFIPKFKINTQKKPG